MFSINKFKNIDSFSDFAIPLGEIGPRKLYVLTNNFATLLNSISTSLPSSL